MSDERIITVFGLPCERDAEELTRSGIGLSFRDGWSTRRRSPTGCASAPARRPRGGNTSAPTSTGTSSASTSARAGCWMRRRRRAFWRAPGRAGPAARPPTTNSGVNSRSPNVWARGSPPSPGASWHDRSYCTRIHLDGPVWDANLRGSWVVAPTARGRPLRRLRGAAAKVAPRAPPRALARHGHHRRPSPGLHAARRCAGPTTSGAGSPSSLTAARGRTGPVLEVLCLQPGAHVAGVQPRTRRRPRDPQEQRPAPRLQPHLGRTAVRSAVPGGPRRAPDRRTMSRSLPCQGEPP